MKRLLLPCVLPMLAFVPFPALAGHDGFYVGVAVGSAFVTANPGLSTRADYLNNTNQPVNFLTVMNETEILKDNNFRGDIYAGFGMTWQQLYLGAEFFAGIEHYQASATITSDNSTTFGNISYNTANTTAAEIGPYHAGVDFRPGFLLNPGTLVYGRGGVSFSHIKMNSTTTFFGGDQSLPETFRQVVPLSHSRNVAALRLGFGLEQHITPELSLRADYVYTNYGRLNMNGAARQLVLPSGSTVNTRQRTAGRLTDNTVLLGIGYSFC